MPYNETTPYCLPYQDIFHIFADCPKGQEILNRKDKYKGALENQMLCPDCKNIIRNQNPEQSENWPKDNSIFTKNINTVGYSEFDKPAKPEPEPDPQPTRVKEEKETGKKKK